MPRQPKLRLSILDLSPVPSGSTSAQALQNTLDLARLADGLGYHRVWLAEHHNSEGVASSSPGGADRPRGLGDHAHAGGRGRHHAAQPLQPEGGRAVPDPGGPAPGPHRLGAGTGAGHGRAHGHGVAPQPGGHGPRPVPEQLGELLAFLGEGFPADHPYRRLKAVPADAGPVPVWLLSSSGYGAQAASQLGLGLAFAHHIHPDPCVGSMRLYREQFQPSAAFPKPQSILTVAALCAPSREEAEDLAGSFDLMRLRLGQGRTGPFPSVAEAQAYPYEAADQELIRQNRNRFFVGTPKDVKEQLAALAGECGADEIMVMTMVHEHALRKRSYELLAKEFGCPRAPGEPGKDPFPFADAFAIKWLIPNQTSFQEPGPWCLQRPALS